jgi:hypothetical protein
MMDATRRDKYYEGEKRKSTSLFLPTADFRYSTAGRFPGSLVCPSDKISVYVGMSLNHWCNDIDRERRSTRTKTRISASLFTTVATWTDLGSNAGLLSESSGNDRQSRGAASVKK